MAERRRTIARTQRAVPAQPSRRSSSTTSGTDGTGAARRVLALQRTVGNRVVARLLRERLADGTPVVQRGPARTLPPQTRRWDVDEPYRGTATVHRSTRIEASGWAEVGPAAAPRVTYRREVRLTTTDGISVYLDLRGTSYLNPGTALPTGPEAALALVGRLVRTQRTLQVDGGDVIPVNEYAPQDSQATSLNAAALRDLPGYAQLPLTVAQQETALLALLRTLPRVPTATTDPDEVSTAEIAANVATDFIPIIGELKDLYRAVTGRDPVTGEKLAWWERALAFIGAIPLVGKLMKATSRFTHLLSRAGKWLGGKFAGFGSWVAERFERWMASRRAKRLAKAQADARKLAAGEEEIRRLAQARRLAMTAAPTLEEVKKLVPPGTDWQRWGIELFGQGPAQALARIGARTPDQLRALGVNRDVAQALYNWYRSLPVSQVTRTNRMELLQHMIGIL